MEEKNVEQTPPLSARGNTQEPLSSSDFTMDICKAGSYETYCYSSISINKIMMDFNSYLPMIHETRLQTFYFRVHIDNGICWTFCESIRNPLILIMIFALFNVCNNLLSCFNSI